MVCFTTFQPRSWTRTCCSDYEELGPSKVVLDNGRLSGSVTVDGSFTMYVIFRNGFVNADGTRRPDVQPGEYLLSIQSHNYTFDQVSTLLNTSPEDVYWLGQQLRVDVTPTDTEPTIHPFIIGTPFNPVSSITIPFPVILTPRSKNTWFVPKEGFNLLGMFQNPMMLIMVFTGVMMFAMPYIMVCDFETMVVRFSDSTFRNLWTLKC